MLKKYYKGDFARHCPIFHHSEMDTNIEFCIIKLVSIPLNPKFAYSQFCILLILDFSTIILFNILVC